MGFSCIKGSRECTGCMACQETPTYNCPICGNIIYDSSEVYVDNDGEIIACECCVDNKDADDVLGANAETYKCPICGETIGWDEKVYLSKGKIFACPNCVNEKNAGDILGGY